MQKALRRRHEDAIERGRGGDLGQLDVVGFDAIDGGGGVDVVLTVPGASGEDLTVS